MRRLALALLVACASEASEVTSTSSTAPAAGTVPSGGACTKSTDCATGLQCETVTQEGAVPAAICQPNGRTPAGRGGGGHR
jgi:hypothetical protein